MISTHLKVSLIGLAALLAAPFAAQAANEAGKVLMLTGQATASGQDGTIRKLAKNDPVYSGDLVNSGVGSYVNIKFADGAFFLLRPETRFQIEDYEYKAAADKAPARTEPAAGPKPAATAAAPLVTATQNQNQGSQTSRAFFRLVKGGFRSVSGLIGKVNRDDYRVVTPVATIGIRGTDYTASLCEGACSDRSEISAQLKQAGASDTPSETVLITTVNEGQIAIQTPESSSNQLPGTVLFTSDTGAITKVEQAPRSVQQDSNLDPKSCGG